MISFSFRDSAELTSETTKGIRVSHFSPRAAAEREKGGRNAMPAEYDPDADPLMGRLVSVRASRVAQPQSSSSRTKNDGDKWLNGVTLYCDTVELDDGTEVGTPNYRMVYGNFKSLYHALSTKKTTQKVSAP